MRDCKYEILKKSFFLQFFIYFLILFFYFNLENGPDPTDWKQTIQVKIASSYGRFVHYMMSSVKLCRVFFDSGDRKSSFWKD